MAGPDDSRSVSQGVAPRNSPGPDHSGSMGVGIGRGGCPRLAGRGTGIPIGPVASDRHFAA